MEGFTLLDFYRDFWEALRSNSMPAYFALSNNGEQGAYHRPTMKFLWWTNALLTGLWIATLTHMGFGVSVVFIIIGLPFFLGSLYLTSGFYFGMWKLLYRVKFSAKECLRFFLWLQIVIMPFTLTQSVFSATFMNFGTSTITSIGASLLVLCFTIVLTAWRFSVTRGRAAMMWILPTVLTVALIAVLLGLMVWMVLLAFKDIDMPMLQMWFDELRKQWDAIDKGQIHII